MAERHEEGRLLGRFDAGEAGCLHRVDPVMSAAEYLDGVALVMTAQRARQSAGLGLGRDIDHAGVGPARQDESGPRRPGSCRAVGPSCAAPRYRRDHGDLVVVADRRVGVRLLAVDPKAGPIENGAERLPERVLAPSTT